jgi:hypothetical protein
VLLAHGARYQLLNSSEQVIAAVKTVLCTSISLQWVFFGFISVVVTVEKYEIRDFLRQYGYIN